MVCACPLDVGSGFRRPAGTSTHEARGGDALVNAFVGQSCHYADELPFDCAYPSEGAWRNLGISLRCVERRCAAFEQLKGVVIISSLHTVGSEWGASARARA